LAVQATRLRRLRTQRAISWTTSLVVLSLALGFVNLATKKHVTLVLDGRSHAIATTSGNVEQLLVGQGIRLTSSMRVQPSPTTRLSDGMTVVVSPAPAAPNGTGVGVWVMDGAAGGDDTVVSQFAETSVSAARVGRPSVVFVRVVVCGKVHDVLTNASTTGELLSAMGIQPDADDLVYPSLQTPLSNRSWIRFDRVDVSRGRRWGKIPFAISTTFTDTLGPGVVQVTRRGVPGLAFIAYRTIRIDGHLYRRHVIGRLVRREPVTEMLLSGPAPSTGGSLGGSHRNRAGLASWYDPPWTGLTAASPWLPFGTHVTVTDLATGLSVVVIINDRGPFAPGKIIDLSPEAFQALSSLSRGVLDVRISW
jgi:resuscitation-promoting factor RpfB